MSGSGTIRVGDWVVVDSKKGQIIAGAKDNWTFQPADGSGTQNAKDADITPEGFMAVASNVWEVPLESWPEMHSFMLSFKQPNFWTQIYVVRAADASYQLVLRSFVDRMIPFLRPDSVALAMGISSADAIDALKAVPVVILQQLICKFMYKQAGLTTHMFKNLLDAFVAYSGSNILTRNVSAYVDSSKTDKSKFLYRY